MAHLARFKIGGVYHKARIFERRTRRGECSVCKEVRYGILLRFSNPTFVPADKHICHECIIKIAAGLPTSPIPLETPEVSVEVSNVYTDEITSCREQIAIQAETIEHLKQMKTPKKKKAKKKKKSSLKSK